MRAASIVTNRRCNQGCAFCTERRAQDDRWAVAPVAIERAIDAARDAGAEEVVLTGGEPTMRRDLGSLVARARGHGLRVTLETNATLLTAHAAGVLADAGLSRVRVHLPAWGDALDRVTRDPGGFARTLAGIEAARAASLPLELSAEVVRSTASTLAGLPFAVTDRLGRGAVDRLVLVVPVRSPAPEELLRFEEAAPVVLAVEAAGRRAGLPVRLAPHDFPPPCVFPAHTRWESLYSLTPGGRVASGHAPIAACGACVVADRCPGVPIAYLERAGPPTVEPLRDDRARRRLSIVTDVAAQVERELVQKNRYRLPDGRAVTEALVRVVFGCNQDCTFCFVSTHLPGADDARLVAEIDAAGARGEKIVLSGGEPTLHPRLPELVRRAREVSRFAVQIQTNAVRLGDADLARRLAEAGLGEAFVSLHGATAGVSDAVTRAPGTFEPTLRGIDALVAAGVLVILNFVVCRENLEELPAFVDLVVTRWPSAQINFSFVGAFSDVVPRDASMIPRYSDVAPRLHEAVARAERAGVVVIGLESMCGVPLCFAPAHHRHPAYEDVGDDGGEFVRVAACRSCAVASRCFGVRKTYVTLYGEGEFTPVPARGA